MTSLTWSLLFALPIGAATGVLAGLFGIGGGLVMVTALVWLLPTLAVPPEHVMHVALASSLGAIVLTAASSARSHYRRGAILWPSLSRLVPGMLIGGVLGARMAGQLSTQWLQWGVIAFCFVAAWEMWRPKSTHAADDAGATPKHWQLVPGGFAIGIVSALVGIGGGSMTVPLLIHFGAKPVRAVGTSAACGLPIAVAAVIGFAWTKSSPNAAMPPHTIGFLHWPLALALGSTSILFAPYGARLAHKLPGNSLRRAFAGLLVVVALMTWYRTSMIA
ncbi:sulfite exporter TauE/SafE family protein [Ahniella affigens]|uniref:Probable membrane transporter protein n=1 Tax=Ahniella affigens TaxID=2021234 RepID=A0A2P1PMF7_9GAMM|nr:sulfite exporter TauE/SafE family protein [Ahniella affigens]AVP96030.1 sulfite exporter TauE/SafE family protein [Ahniella affigens]